MTHDNNAQAQELEACPVPWCRSTDDPELTGYPGVDMFIVCGGCGAQGPGGIRTAEEAIAAWNTRAQPAPASGEVGELVRKRADECRTHAEASFYPQACHEYRAKEAAFREVLDMLERLAVVSHETGSGETQAALHIVGVTQRMIDAAIENCPSPYDIDVEDREAWKSLVEAVLKEAQPARQHRLRKPQNPKHWPPIDPAEIEARIDALCGCDGRCDCDCISVFGPARVNAWEDYNS